MLAIYGLRSPQAVIPQAKAMALQALEIEPELAEAYVSLALVECVYYWAWSDAEEHFRTALNLAPGYATGFQWYALNCLVPCERFAEAHRTIDRAMALDPVSLPITTSAGLVWYFSGQYDEAALALRRALALDATFGVAHFFLGQALAEAGSPDEARRHAEQAVMLSRRSAETLAGLGYALAVSGDEAGALRILDELETLARTIYVSPSVIAQVLAGLGRAADATALLQQALELRTSDLAWLAVRPTFQSLRKDPAFTALVERLGVRQRISAGAGGLGCNLPSGGKSPPEKRRGP
jgi:tetratricopeptide (TPR) repeat protein